MTAPTPSPPPPARPTVNEIADALHGGEPRPALAARLGLSVPLIEALASVGPVHDRLVVRREVDARIAAAKAGHRFAQAHELLRDAAEAAAESGEPIGPSMRLVIRAASLVCKTSLIIVASLSARLDTFEREGPAELEARARRMRAADAVEAKHRAEIGDCMTRYRAENAKAAWRASGGRGAWNMVAKIREAVRLRKLRLS